MTDTIKPTAPVVAPKPVPVVAPVVVAPVVPVEAPTYFRATLLRIERWRLEEVAKLVKVDKVDGKAVREILEMSDQVVWETKLH